jgi:hypothetical protein
VKRLIQEMQVNAMLVLFRDEHDVALTWSEARKWVREALRKVASTPQADLPI